MQLIVGSSRHGVVRYATRIADAVALADPSVASRGATLRGATLRAASLDELLHRVESGEGIGPAHLHVTDRLLGSNALAAAEAFERLTSLASVSVTLHDLPQPSDGAGFERRAEGYRRIIAAAAAVACSSRHEIQLIEEHLFFDTAAIAVIPLPVAEPAPATGFEASGSASAGSVTRREIAVLGFIYPGKGHAQVLDAVATMPVETRPRVVAMGAPSPGHEADAQRLRRSAAGLGVDLEITGFLNEADQFERCRATAVPVVALQHVSASGSTISWIEAGRRPLVPDSRYGREIDALRPGTVTLYRPEALGSALRGALGDPPSTWLAPNIDTWPHPRDTALAYLSWWAGISR